MESEAPWVQIVEYLIGLMFLFTVIIQTLSCINPGPSILSTEKWNHNRHDPCRPTSLTPPALSGSLETLSPRSRSTPPVQGGQGLGRGRIPF